MDDQFLKSINLPESMFFGADEWSDMKLTDKVHFPNLSETWKEATTDVQVTAKVIKGTGSKLHKDILGSSKELGQRLP